jgi:polyferredoxin
LTRLAFLSVTVVWLGWIAGAQLSVVNVLTFAHSLLTGFRWEFFLLDPLIFILWSYVAVAMLFWARGVFCGWLCPFGALQELLAEAARRLGLPRVQVPFALHERLWPIKYIIFLGLFAVSLNSTNLAVLGAEVEPFKTAIILKFARHWPFVVYVAALLTAGLFIERFFCRYLCPLGAALAIPARLHMFQWLKRRHQCGRECHICATRCPVQAIHPTGAINPNECIHCLKCQRLYYDAFTCPPLITRRKRRAERAALSTPGGQA